MYSKISINYNFFNSTMKVTFFLQFNGKVIVQFKKTKLSLCDCDQRAINISDEMLSYLITLDCGNQQRILITILK